MNKKIITVAVLALSMSLSQATLACGEDHDQVFGKRLQQMTAQLNLSTEQKEKMHVIRVDAAGKIKPLLVEMRDNRKQLNELASAPVVDNEKVDLLVSKQKDLLGDMIKIRIQERHDVSAVLDAKQKSSLDAMEMKWQEKKASMENGE